MSYASRSFGSSRFFGSSKWLAGIGLIGALWAAPALASGTGVFLNGVELSPMQVALVYQATGQVPAPGHYVAEGGCVAHLESGQVACSQGPAADAGGYYGGDSGGYGYDGGDGGAWFHRGSDSSGGYSVGGDGSGCIYTPDWSNC